MSSHPSNHLPFDDLLDYMVPSPKSAPMFVRANGMRIEDEEGKSYLDLEGGPGVVNVGHCHPRVVAAVQEQTARLMHSSGKYHSRLGPELARRISMLTEGRLKKSFFSNSGAEANDGAVKLALKHALVTGRQGLGIIALDHGYHGRLSLPLSLTGLADMKMQMGTFANFPGIVHVPVPYFYRCPYGSETPEQCGDRHAQALRDALKTRVAGEAAMMIAEPILGVGGVIVPPDNYWPQVAEICRENRITLIMDEVLTGFGRTGSMFGYQLWGIEPDIVTFAKAIGGGLPLGGFIAREEIANAFKNNDHNTTFGPNNQVGLAAAHAVLDILEEERLVERADVAGRLLMKGLKQLTARYHCIGEVRGKGLMIGVEIVKDRHSKTPAADIAKALQLHLREMGLILGVGGVLNNVLRLTPPLTMTDSDIEEALALFDKAFRSALDGI